MVMPAGGPDINQMMRSHQMAGEARNEMSSNKGQKDNVTTTIEGVVNNSGTFMNIAGRFPGLLEEVHVTGNLKAPSVCGDVMKNVRGLFG